MKRHLLTILLVIFAALMVGAVFAQDTPEASPLLRMLRFVPNTPENRQYVTYGDLAAWHASWGIPRVDSIQALDGLDERERGYWLYVMPRQTIPPDTLGLQYMKVDDLKGTYGFDLFSVDRYLLAGQPPDWITVLDFSFDGQQIADALTAAGYEAAPVEGGTLYSILDDYAIDIRMEKVKTRTGQLGNLNRIALLDGQLVIGKATPVIAGALEANAGKTVSLADDPSYIALAAALEDPALVETGNLVGALLIDGTLLMPSRNVIPSLMGPNKSPEEIEKAIQKYQEDYLNRYPLPPYTLAAFLTTHTEGATYLVLALVLMPGSDADAAAEALVGRIENYTSVAMKVPMTEILDQHGAVIDFSIGLEANGLPLAVLAIRNDDPPAEFVPGKVTGDDSSGKIMFDWVNTVLRQDTDFLATTP